MTSQDKDDQLVLGTVRTKVESSTSKSASVRVRRIQKLDALVVEWRRGAGARPEHGSDDGTM
jgi:hypothetical protein